MLPLQMNAQENTDKIYIEQDKQIEFSPPQTLNSGQIIVKAAKERREAKTIDRYIPEIGIVSLDSDSLFLTDVINRRTYIGYSDLHCGFGTEHIEIIFPELMECSYYEEGYSVILLIGIDSASYIGSEQYIKDLDWYLHYYRDRSMVYFIDFDEAQKVNFFASPSHMITTDEGRVISYETGLKDLDYLLKALVIE